MKKPQDKVTNWDIGAIRPYEGNAKIHTEEQIKSIAKSIATFGFDQPIVVDGAGVIIKGHGRHKAAEFLDMKKVPVIVREDLTANEADASRLADNRGAVGDLDTNILNEELERIAAFDEDLLDNMGFSEKELEFMTSDLGAMDESALMDTFATDTGEVVSEALSDSASVSSKRIASKDIFGFTHMDGDQAKVVARWLNVIQGEHGTQDTAVAMAAHAKESLKSE